MVSRAGLCLQLKGRQVKFGRVAIALLAAMILVRPGVADQRYATPPPASAERGAVLDAARVPVEKDLGQAIIFQVKTLRVTPNWAFLHGIPKLADGKPVDYSKSIYAQIADDGAFSGEAAVLLAREGTGWRLVTYSVGFSDVVWETWDEEFGAPSWLWP
jgi:hypothetical protein